MSNLAVVSRKAEDAYPTSASGPCSQFLVESELPVYFSYFVCFILVILYSLLCLSGLCSWITFFNESQYSDDAVLKS